MSAQARPPPPGTNDTAFIVELTEKLVRDGVADPKRIYITGVSNGGAMTMTLACQRSEVFAAAGTVVMALSETMAKTCQPSKPIAMLLMSGTDDPIVNYGGGRGRSRIAVSHMLSAIETLAFWRRVNGCDLNDSKRTELPDIDPTDHSTVTRIESHCPAQTDAVLYRVNSGGHRMPGYNADARMPNLVDRILGPQNHDIDGAQTIWDFLKRFSRS